MLTPEQEELARHFLENDIEEEPRKILDDLLTLASSTMGAA